MCRKLFEKYSTVTFEGLEFMSVEDYDLFLKTLYKDYMKLPPVEKRNGVMNAVKYNLIKLDYESLVKEYEKNNNI